MWCIVCLQNYDATPQNLTTDGPSGYKGGGGDHVDAYGYGRPARGKGVVAGYHGGPPRVIPDPRGTGGSAGSLSPDYRDFPAGKPGYRGVDHRDSSRTGYYDDGVRGYESRNWYEADRTSTERGYPRTAERNPGFLSGDRDEGAHFQRARETESRTAYSRGLVARDVRAPDHYRATERSERAMEESYRSGSAHPAQHARDFRRGHPDDSAHQGGYFRDADDPRYGAPGPRDMSRNMSGSGKGYPIDFPRAASGRAHDRSAGYYSGRDVRDEARNDPAGRPARQVIRLFCCVVSRLVLSFRRRSLARNFRVRTHGGPGHFDLEFTFANFVSARGIRENFPQSHQGPSGRPGGIDSDGYADERRRHANFSGGR